MPDDALLPALSRSYDTGFVLLAVALVVSSLVYGAAMLVASRRQPRRLRQTAHRGTGAHRARVRGTRSVPAAPDLFFVFVLPCLNEQTVIRASIERLLSVPGDHYAVLVVDDGSDDDTADVVTGLGNDRVWLLRRVPPRAREGKGEALNAAVHHLLSSGRLADRDLDEVILVVVDADGRLEPRAVSEVAPYFDDPRMGGVQVGVRINNRSTSLLARMQDMEFVIYTEVFQRGRRHLDSVGLGGNGQFMRLSALLSLGTSPWSRSLTEDLDLGLRLLARGWRNDFCSTAAVHQQGVVEVGKLVRQRSRWFQGHLQSGRLVPLVLTSVPRRARADLLYHLSSPVLLLIASFMTASFVLSLLASLAYGLRGGNPLGWWVLTTYLLTFAPSIAYSCIYWLREREHLSLLHCTALAHVYVLYGLMWYVAGWWAVSRSVRGRTGWAKTERTAEPAGAAAAA